LNFEKGKLTTKIEELVKTFESQQQIISELKVDICSASATPELDKFLENQESYNRNTSETLSDMRAIQEAFSSKAEECTNGVEEIIVRFTEYDGKHFECRALAQHSSNLLTAADSVFSNQHALKAEMDGTV
jgi:hypothetical protein